jgi:hypothetical protein
MAYNFVETIAKVSGQGAASCYSCGYGEICRVGVPIMVHGEGVKITDDMIRQTLSSTADRRARPLTGNLEDAGNNDGEIQKLHLNRIHGIMTSNSNKIINSK